MAGQAMGVGLMALFKPKQGYMSKPMQEQPMAAPKPTMGMMQTQQPRRSLMSVPDAGQQRPAIEYRPQAQPSAPSAPGFKFTASMFPGLAGGQAMADALNAQAAQPAQGAQGAPAQAGKKYSLVINQFDTPQEAAAKAAAVPPEVRATIPQTVSAGYRTPVRSRVEDVANPFGQNYLQSLEERAISNTAQQMGAQREQIRAMLASRGLMSGGGTGLEAQLMAQAMGEGYRARAEAVDRARTQTALEAANFEQRRAQLIDAYNRGLMSDAQALALLPGQIRLGEAQAGLGEAQEQVARRTVEPTVQSRFSEAEQRGLEVESMQLANALKRYTPEQQAQIRESVLKKAVSEGLIDERGAQELLRETDPNAWWNHPGWRIARGVMDFQKHIASILGSVISATGGGR